MQTDKIKKRVVLSFSGGKDSVLSLYKLLKSDEYEVMTLLTTLDPDNRVPMHGFDAELLKLQAQSLGIPLIKITIPRTKGEESQYAEKMKEELEAQKEKGVTCVAYGDIYLESVRKFREEKLSIVDMQSVFPLWGIDTKELGEEFLKLGFNAIITCVNTNLISKEWIGRQYSKEFIDFLIEKNIDPCGENGEFHTFVYSGPLFKEKINYQMDFQSPLIHNEFYAYIAKKQS